MRLTKIYVITKINKTIGFQNILLLFIKTFHYVLTSQLIQCFYLFAYNINI
jgi:hypothetical protein